MSVGVYRNSSNNIVPLSYTTGNGGASWSLSPLLPLPSDVAGNGVQNSELQSVRCDSAGIHCVAVGYYRNSFNNLVPLSYNTANGGATWSLSPLLPLPSDVAANGGQNSELQGISCSSTGIHCSAVGYYLNSRNNVVPLSYVTTNGGLNWALSSPPPLPVDVAGSGGQTNKLQSVICDSSASHCSAMGAYLNSTNNLAPLSYISANGGVTWSFSETLSLPVDVAANGIQKSILFSVG